MVPKINSLLILATDHRDVFEQRYDGDANTIAAAKALVVDGARTAQRRYEDELVGQLGVIVDEQYASSCVGSARRAGLQVAMPAERGGSPELALTYGEDFRSRLRALPPDFVKLLVRWSPNDEAGRKRRQGEVIRELQSGLDELGLPLMFELIVPEASAPGTGRSDLTQAAMAEVVAAGAKPAVWKLEPQDGAAGYGAVAMAAAGTPCVVLGAGGRIEEIAEHVRLAAATDGWIGFAVGRTIWKPALDAWDAGAPREECVAQVAVRFANLIDAYRDAE